MVSLQSDIGGKCACPYCVAPAVFFVSSLHRELHRSDEHRLREARNEGDLSLTDSVFGTASGIFFIGYFALQVPGALLVERWSARLLLGITLITWGALTALTWFCSHPASALRRALSPWRCRSRILSRRNCLPFHWFIEHDRAKAVARFMSAIPIGFIIGGPLAGIILNVHWLGLAGWRWLFIFEGIPAVLLGTLTLFVLPDRPNEARWLPPEESEWLTSRLDEERLAKAHVQHMTVWQALRHPPVLILTAGLFFTYTGGYAVWFWMPTILQRFTGWTVQQISWVGSIPFVAGLIGLLLLGWNSDRTV
jgi:ACS family tartrate transporter-like MFS transporter